jgi:transposase
MSKADRPQIVQLNGADLDRLLEELRPLLAPGTYHLVESLLRTLQWIMGLLERKDTTLARLRRIIFGEKTEKIRKIFPKKSVANPEDAAGALQPKRKGHGRNGAEDYPGAKRVKVSHPHLRLGDLCPKCLKGKLYLLKKPAQLVRIVAQPVFQATIFELERLRCALCGALFTAPAPPEAGENKYDSSVGVMLAIQRYGMGQPMYRTDKWQTHFGVPLPAPTQWELIDEASETPETVYEALIEVAAQGTLFHNDDTPMRVLALQKEISLCEDEDQRRGLFTTSVVAKTDGHLIALFFTGQKHAGENLDQVLKHREADLPKALQMCDGLARNHSKLAELILCNCLLHGRRGFVDVIDRFPQEGRKVIESLAEIYRLEAIAKEEKLSDAQRLAFHQEHSKPIMDELHRWMQEQLDQKKVEPKSGLGEAIRYMLKRWEPLTRFLSVPGAPLDNNLCERAIKMAILHRKNSLSYLTLHGAHVGDIFMSLIHTCELNHINPFEYMMALQKHAKRVESNPTQWLPWNYRQTLQTLDTG